MTRSDSRSMDGVQRGDRLSGWMTDFHDELHRSDLVAAAWDETLRFAGSSVQSKIRDGMIGRGRSPRRVRSCSLLRSKGSSRSPGRGTCVARADALSISQPALTARLQALEEELGAGLFRRTHAGMVLTPAGRAFLPHADRAIEAIRSGGSIVRELEHGRDRRACACRCAGGQRLRPAGDPGPLHGASPERSTARADRPFGGDRGSRGSRRGRARDRQTAPRRARPQPSAVRGRAPPGRPAGPPVRRRGHASTSRRSATPSSSCSTGRRATTT